MASVASWLEVAIGAPESAFFRAAAGMAPGGRRSDLHGRIFKASEKRAGTTVGAFFLLVPSHARVVRDARPADDVAWDVRGREIPTSQAEPRRALAGQRQSSSGLYNQ